jgi:hypothetical protein
VRRRSHGSDPSRIVAFQVLSFGCHPHIAVRKRSRLVGYDGQLNLLDPEFAQHGSREFPYSASKASRLIRYRNRDVSATAFDLPRALKPVPKGHFTDLISDLLSGDGPIAGGFLIGRFPHWSRRRRRVRRQHRQPFCCQLNLQGQKSPIPPLPRSCRSAPDLRSH